ncbi:MAG TPA: GntR family transcriptional regulator, partial [Vicinamibacterales bacterium]
MAPVMALEFSPSFTLVPVRTPSADSGQTRLTREFGVPLYQQIQHLIRHRITSGHYAPGSQIPSENDLCRELNVSRVTLREALRELVRDDMLVKIQGKGTFVNANPPRRLAPVKYAGFLDELQERMRKLTVKNVEVDTVAAGAELEATLRLEGGAHIVRIRRLRLIDEEPFSFTINYLPVEIGRKVPAKALQTIPLLRILQEDLKIPITGAHETIEAAPADPEIARKLAIPALYPVMHMKRVMFTTGNRPFELVETYYRADKYHYSVNLVRVKRKGKWTWRTQV